MTISGSALRATWCLPLLGLAACGSSLEPQVDALSMARARWTTAAVHSYDFDLQVSCFCPQAVLPATISVRDDQFAGIVRTDSGTPVDSTYYMGYLTIDQMFTTLRGILDRHPAAFTATYDADLGFPKQVSVDGNTQVADDELTLRIASLRVVGASGVAREPALIASRRRSPP